MQEAEQPVMTAQLSPIFSVPTPPPPPRQARWTRKREGGGNLTDRNTAGITFTPELQGLSGLSQTTVLYNVAMVLSAVEEKRSCWQATDDAGNTQSRYSSLTL